MAIPDDVRLVIVRDRLTERSSWKATIRTVAVAVPYISLFLAGRWLDHPVTWIAAWTGMGTILIGSYSAMHEAAHGTLYRSSAVNRVAGTLWASTILVNWSLWRSFHLEHHAHTGSDRDPKLEHKVTITRWRTYSRLPVGGLGFMVQLWGQSAGTLFGRYPSYVRGQRSRRGIRIGSLLLLLTTAVLVAGAIAEPALLLQLWIAPMLFTFCLLLPATGMSEHYGCATEGEVFDTTRTVITNRLFRFLLWNNNFHTAHHLVPSVPFHHAPALHAVIADRTYMIDRSYTDFHRKVLVGCSRRAAAADHTSLPVG